MTTNLTKPVKRRTSETVRERSKLKRIIVTIYPGGESGPFFGLRLEKNRTEERLPIGAAWSLAVKMRVMAARADRAKREKEGKR